MTYKDTSWITVKVKDRNGSERILSLDTLSLDLDLVEKDDRFLVQLTPEYFLAEEFTTESEAKDAIAHLIEIGNIAGVDKKEQTAPSTNTMKGQEIGMILLLRDKDGTLYGRHIFDVELDLSITKGENGSFHLNVTKDLEYYKTFATELEAEDALIAIAERYNTCVWDMMTSDEMGSNSH